MYLIHTLKCNIEYNKLVHGLRREKIIRPGLESNAIPFLNRKGISHYDFGIKTIDFESELADPFNLLVSRSNHDQQIIFVYVFLLPATIR